MLVLISSSSIILNYLFMCLRLQGIFDNGPTCLIFREAEFAICHFLYVLDKSVGTAFPLAEDYYLSKFKCGYYLVTFSVGFSTLE